MKKFAVIIGLLLSYFASAQLNWQIAVINDPDGFTFVRSGNGKSFPVVDTIPEDAFFYCTGDTTLQWLSIQTPMGKTGFMHRSRVIFFHALDSTKQHELILEAFTEVVSATKAYYESKAAFGSKEKTLLNQKRDAAYEEKYLPAYYAFEKLFCEKPDSILLVAFFKTRSPLSGSADEGIDWTSAKCWLCYPKFVENIVCHWKDENERQTIISSIETGMAMSNYEAQFTPAELKKKYASLEKKCAE